MTDSEHGLHYLAVGDQRLVEFERFDDETPNANELRLLAPLAEAVPVILDQLGGWRVAPVDDVLADALEAAGAKPLRHSIIMQRALTDNAEGPPPPTFDHVTDPTTDQSIEPVAGHERAMAELSLLAYPASHPDHFTSEVSVTLNDIRGLVNGSIVGPLLSSSSAVALDGTGRAVAVCLINRMPHDNLTGGGPWVSEVFRDPSDRHRGLGRGLLQRAIRVLSLEGEKTLTLVVTVGNPARSMYEQLGFAVVAERRKLELPATTKQRDDQRFAAD